MIKITTVSLIVLALFIVLDLLWFRVMGEFFSKEIGSIARLSTDGAWNVRIGPAVLVYVLMTIGLMTFVVTRASGMAEAVLFGALFGMLAYGIYDLTNLATLTAWTIRFAVVDIAWGTTLNALVATIAYGLLKWIR